MKPLTSPNHLFQHSRHILVVAAEDVDIVTYGDADLAVTNASSDNVSVLLNNGDGTFATKIDYVVGDSPESVFAADFDGDGDIDLAVANGRSGNVSLLLNNGDGTFAAKTDYEAGDGPKSIFASDLDGDGDVDLVVANSSGDNISVLMNQ